MCADALHTLTNESSSCSFTPASLLHWVSSWVTTVSLYLKSLPHKPQQLFDTQVCWLVTYKAQKLYQNTLHIHCKHIASHHTCTLTLPLYYIIIMLLMVVLALVRVLLSGNAGVWIESLAAEDLATSAAFKTAFNTRFKSPDMVR